MIVIQDLKNSCMVCRSPNEDGDYQCLYQTIDDTQRKAKLSKAGILYEELFGIIINTENYFPQFLCNSCDLQMKLFKKLKDKAENTLLYLQELCEETGTSKESQKEYISLDNEYNEFKVNITQDCQENLEEYLENNTNIEENELVECSDNDFEDNVEMSDEQQENMAISCIPFSNRNVSEITAQEKKNEKLNARSTHKKEKLEKKNLLEQISNINGELRIDSQSNNILKYHSIEEEVNYSLQENASNIEKKLKPIIGEDDYVTEIYEVLNENDANYSEDELEYEEIKDNYSADNISTFEGVEYIIEDNVDTSNDTDNYQDSRNVNPLKTENLTKKKKREYKCAACQMDFKNLNEHKLHRTQVHNEKYPCDVCYKELKSLGALHHHMKKHKDKPDFQCDICPKTFWQKCNYQYHMNRHNNIRNFKCNLCEKAFISKADLKIHLRFHTGERPYVCNICDKDYLMMEHLKTHLLSHSGQCFLCHICNKKFTNHKTLRFHVQTIHTDKPKFKCTLCLKTFRRKHHLQYHIKSHQNKSILESAFAIIDDTDLLDYDDEYAVDEPEFIALSDEYKVFE